MREEKEEGGGKKKERRAEKERYTHRERQTHRERPSSFCHFSFEMSARARIGSGLGQDWVSLGQG